MFVKIKPLTNFLLLICILSIYGKSILHISNELQLSSRNDSQENTNENKSPVNMTKFGHYNNSSDTYTNVTANDTLLQFQHVTDDLQSDTGNSNVQNYHNTDFQRDNTDHGNVTNVINVNIQSTGINETNVFDITLHKGNGTYILAVNVNVVNVTKFGTEIHNVTSTENNVTNLETNNHNDIVDNIYTEDNITKGNLNNENSNDNETQSTNSSVVEFENENTQTNIESNTTDNRINNETVFEDTFANNGSIYNNTTEVTNETNYFHQSKEEFDTLPDEIISKESSSSSSSEETSSSDKPEMHLSSSEMGTSFEESMYDDESGDRDNDTDYTYYYNTDSQLSDMGNLFETDKTTTDPYRVGYNDEMGYTTTSDVQSHHTSDTDLKEVHNENINSRLENLSTIDTFITDTTTRDLTKEFIVHYKEITRNTPQIIQETGFQESTSPTFSNSYYVQKENSHSTVQSNEVINIDEDEEHYKNKEQNKNYSQDTNRDYHTSGSSHIIGDDFSGSAYGPFSDESGSGYGSFSDESGSGYGAFRDEAGSSYGPFSNKYTDDESTS